MSISLLLTGSELLDGRTHDTNSHFLIDYLNDLGFQITNCLSCGDSIAEIESSLTFLSTKSQVIIVSGGLGPTTDDLTREGIAKFLNGPLEKNQKALEDLQKYFASRKRPFDSSNEKQAFFPANSLIIENPVGSAKGFAVRFSLKNGAFCGIISLPAVPRELRSMAKELPSILNTWNVPQSPKHQRFLQVFGVGEAIINGRLIGANLPPEIEVCFRVAFPQVEVVLRAKDDMDLDICAAAASSAIGAEFVIATESSTSLVEVVHKLLINSKQTISVAESCTGGLIGSLITGLSDSSQYFLGGVISYSNSLKENLLQVSSLSIEQDTAVSSAVASQMAEGIRSKTQSTFGISVTGIAGPAGGSEKNPVGTFYVGLASGRSTNSYRFFYPGSRDQTRLYAAYCALDLLRRHLLGLEMPAESKLL